MDPWIDRRRISACNHHRHPSCCHRQQRHSSPERHRLVQNSHRSSVALSLILIIGMHVLPETPRYCIKRGDVPGATRALARLRRLRSNYPAVIKKMEEIRANYIYEMSLGSSSYKDCFGKIMLKRMLTCMALQILQQLTGSSSHRPIHLLPEFHKTTFDSN